jgi:imidazolonepropionase
MSDLFVENIGELLTFAAADHRAPAEQRLGVVRDAVAWIERGVVRYAGARADFDATRVPKSAARIDARGRLVTPGLVDPHTHLVFAGSRAGEFDLRVRGATYAEIQRQGGGIHSTVKATNAASDDGLVELALERLGRSLSFGTTALEAKSGYALTIDGELRLLNVIAQIRKRVRQAISPTLLAHVLPKDASAGTARADYVKRFCDEAIARASTGKLADCVDVYCDEGAFTLAETRAILEAGKRHGLALRVHAEQFTHTGASRLAAELGARSVEHLEAITDDDRKALAAAGTICTLLPGAALTLRLPWPDAHRLLAAGCRVALGTDLNPGSSLSENLPLMMSLACMQMGMSAAQAWCGVTLEAAAALGRADLGRLAPDARGDLVVWNADDHREVPQHFGVSLAAHVAIGGELL